MVYIIVKNIVLHINYIVHIVNKLKIEDNIGDKMNKLLETV
jgi:hypothetical protein